MKFIFTDEDKYLADEYQEAWLSYETGWWTPKGEIYVYTYKISKPRQIGILVHETFEYLLVHRCLRWYRGGYFYDLVCTVSHYVANLLEIVASLGTTDVLRDKDCWGYQRWKGSKRGGVKRGDHK